jgi:hypothetical protein
LWEGVGDSSGWGNYSNPLTFAAKFRCAGQAVLKTTFSFKFSISEINVRSVEKSEFWNIYCNMSSQITSYCIPSPCYNSEQYLVEELWGGVLPHGSIELHDALTEVNA